MGYNPYRLGMNIYAGVVNPNTAQGRAMLDLQVNQQAMAVAYADNVRLMMYGTTELIPLVFLLRAGT